MSYGVEVYNSEGTKIVGPDSSLGTIIAHGVVPANTARYDAILAANPNAGNIMNGSALYIWGELVDIQVNVPNYINNSLHEIIIIAPTNIIVGNASVLSKSNGSFMLRRNDKSDAAWYAVRRG